MKSYSATDVGRLRQLNQDSVFSSDRPVGNLPNLYIVADGMGGHRAGDFASRYAVNTVKGYIAESNEMSPVKLIDEAIRLANTGVIREADEHPEMLGMGTTIVVMTVCGDNVYLANVGDSRLYYYDGTLTQITRDHSLVEEMVRMGELTKDAAKVHPDRHVITRAIGASEELEIDFFEFERTPGSVILMCSDGLSNMVDDEEIAGILSRPADLRERVEGLIRAANDNGGKDNIAVILAGPDA